MQHVRKQSRKLHKRSADTLSGPGTVQRNVGHLGLEAIDVTTSGRITLSLSGDAEVTARAVGIRDRQASVFDFASSPLFSLIAKVSALVCGSR